VAGIDCESWIDSDVSLRLNEKFWIIGAGVRGGSLMQSFVEAPVDIEIAETVNANCSMCFSGGPSSFLQLC